MSQPEPQPEFYCALSITYRDGAGARARAWNFRAHEQPLSALRTAVISSAMVTTPSRSSSNAAHAFTASVPSAMSTPRTSSSTETSLSSLQSPAQADGGGAAMAIDVGFSPTGMVATTLRVPVSMTDTVPGAVTLNGCRFATYANRPSAVSAIPSGPLPTWTVSATLWVVVSMMETLLELKFVT